MLHPRSSGLKNTGHQFGAHPTAITVLLSRLESFRDELTLIERFRRPPKHIPPHLPAFVLGGIIRYFVSGALSL
eukprot:scaffold926_cov408-Prasinococcus_capsulatus_cf.AAC.31